jgi:hypothetical protein
MARLGLWVARREGRRRTRLVGDHADQPAGLKAPAQLHAPGRTPTGSVPHGGGGAVPDRVGGQLGRDDDGVVDQFVQLPPAQRGRGELASGPGRLRHGCQPDTAPPPRSGERGTRGLPGAVAIARGLGGSRLTSLVHGWTTEPEVGRVRHRSAHQLRCHLGCADASALAHDRRTRDLIPRNGAGKSSVSSRSRRKETLQGWRPAAERDERWIWCLAPCCPRSCYTHSCGPRNGGRAVTAIPAVTAWKWPGSPGSGWPCATPIARTGLRCCSPAPRGSASCTASGRAPVNQR